VISAERVLESRMCGAGIDEKRQAELADISQALKDIRVDKLECQLIDTDIVPEWIPQYLELR
jgi:hypothetical protein